MVTEKGSLGWIQENGGRHGGRSVPGSLMDAKKGWIEKANFGYSRSPRRAWPYPVSPVAMVVTLGVVPARLCLTLPRMTPRLRVLIPISPFKFLWYEQHAGQLSHRPAGIRDRETIRHVTGIRSSLICLTGNIIGVPILNAHLSCLANLNRYSRLVVWLITSVESGCSFALLLWEPILKLYVRL